MRNSILLLVCSAAILLGLTAEPPPSNPKPSTVRLVIDYADGVQKHFTTLKHTPGMTVLDAMKLAQAPALTRGIRFDSTGANETAFIRSIDDLKNEGGGPMKKNWVFKVNDQRGKASCGAVKLEKGDVVLWEFTIYMPTEDPKKP